MIEPLTIVSGVAAPLMRQNVDTDVIIRIERLMEKTRDELGPHAFEAWRYRADGTPDPGFILNQPPFDRAPILLAGANFGCGSSREGAVWALQCLGIRCVVAPSFGDIFYGNCFQNGVLPIVLPQEQMDSLAPSAARGEDFRVDLGERVLVAPDGRALAFDISVLRREMLMKGLDELGLTLRREAEIQDFQDRDRRERSWIYLGR